MKLAEALNLDLAKVEEMKKFCTANDITDYTFNADGTVDVRGSVYISHSDIASIPMKFRLVTGDFDCRDTKISSIEHFPEVVGMNLWFQNTPIKSLSGIHKIVKTVGHLIHCPVNSTHLLGLLLIHGNFRINISGQPKISAILNKHRADSNVLLAQDELIDAGFIEQAKL